MKNKFEQLFKDMGFRLNDELLLTEAFTHRSALNEGALKTGHNERLEFLGDAVLELIVTDYLFRNFKEDEGVLTNLRSALVKGEHLAKVAKKLDLGEYLLLSRGEARSGGASKDYLLANVVEALIGAIFMEQGVVRATEFVRQFILIDLEEILSSKEYVDAKSEFQELVQEKLGITPHYKTIGESGKDHEKTFVVEACIDNKKVGEGVGKSKKEAQVNAADKALEKRTEWLPMKEVE